MKYNILGRTGLLVSELCLGTMTFGGKGGFWSKIGQLDLPAVTDLVRSSLDAGINFIDTADVYSEGESERLLGQALKDIGVARREIVVATKCLGRTGPGVNNIGLSRGHILSAVQESLDRLGTDYIDLYQIHGVDLATPVDETLRALDDVVRSGRVRYIGCSNQMAWHVMKALGVSAARDLARFESVQAFYSIAARDIERELVPLLRSEALSLLVWSPLAGGLLSGKFRRNSAGPNNARRTVFDFPPVEREHSYQIIEGLEPIAKRRGVSMARVALAWLLHKTYVTSVIVGAKTVEQLEDNIAATEFKLTSEEIATLDALSALIPEYPQWMVERQNSDRFPAKAAQV